MYLTRAAARLHLRRGTFRKRRDRALAAPRRAGKAPIDPYANIFRSPKDTPPLRRQYFRVWLGHQFVIKTSPLPAAAAAAAVVSDGTVAGLRVIILNRAAPGPSISSFH